MILIGQYDSPFVRRVAIAMRLYGMPSEHRPWSTFGDADLVARFNPLRRMPTLVLDDGEALIESTAIQAKMSVACLRQYPPMLRTRSCGACIGVPVFRQVADTCFVACPMSGADRGQVP